MTEAEALAEQFERLGQTVHAHRDESGTWRIACLNRATPEQGLHDTATVERLSHQAGTLLPGGGGADPRTAWCNHVHENCGRYFHVPWHTACFALASASALRDLPQPRLLVDNNHKQPMAIIDGTAHAVSGEMAEFLTALIAANGKFVSAAKYGVRSRDIDALPAAIQSLITRGKRGQGSAIDPQRLIARAR